MYAKVIKHLKIMKSIWKAMKPYFLTKKEHPTRKEQEKD